MSPIWTGNEQGASEYAAVRCRQCACERKHYCRGDAYLIGYQIGFIGIPVYRFIRRTVVPRAMRFIRGLNKESMPSEKGQKIETPGDDSKVAD